MFVYFRMGVTGIGHGYGEAGAHLKIIRAALEKAGNLRC